MASRDTLTKSTSTVFFKTSTRWWFLLLASSLVAAYPVRENRATVDLLDGVQEERMTLDDVQKEVCNVGKSDLVNLYRSFHEDYASAAKDGTPAAGPFDLSNLRSAIVWRGARLETPNCPSECLHGNDSVVEWCVRLASSSHNTTTCLSAEGHVVSQSPISELIGLEEYLEVETSPDGGPPKLVVKETTAVFNWALMTCIVMTATCKDIMNTYLIVKTPANKPLLAVKEVPPQEVYFSEGEQVTLRCVFEAGPYGHSVNWFNEEDEFEQFISEDPHCESCAPDPAVPEDDARRSAPVRAFFYQETASTCPDTIDRSIGELVIDTSRVDITDGTTYTCTGSYYQHSTSISYSTRLQMRQEDPNTSPLVDNNNNVTSADNWTAECTTSNALSIIGDPSNLTGDWSHNGKLVNERPAGSTCQEDGEVFSTRQYSIDSQSAHLQLLITLVACGMPYTAVNEYRCEPGFLDE